MLLHKTPDLKSYTYTYRLIYMYRCILTFRHFHGVHATQQVSDIKAIPLHLTQPVVTSKVEPQVRSDHIRHHHSVQEPAGVNTSVVMLNSEATEK